MSIINKIASFFFPSSNKVVVQLSYEDEQLQLAEARKAKAEAMKEAAKKVALIKQLNAEAAAFDAASLAIKIAEDLADAEEFAEQADKNYAIFDSMMSDPKAAVAAVRAARQANNKKTNP